MTPFTRYPTYARAMVALHRHAGRATVDTKSKVIPMPHEITPHKGGRTTTINLSLTPDEKARLKQLAQERGMSVPDLVVWLMNNVNSTTTPQK